MTLGKIFQLLGAYMSLQSWEGGVGNYNRIHVVSVLCAHIVKECE